MKISFNVKIPDGPSGGGLNFARALKTFLNHHDIQVVDHLNDTDIDLILMLNVTYSSCYSIYDAYGYKLKHPHTRIVQRVNDSGLQRATPLMTQLLSECGKYCDHLVYVSQWLQQTMQPRLSQSRPHSVIPNGADSQIYNKTQRAHWDGSSKLKIVTHHWSNNPKKGHEIYQQLDQCLGQTAYSDKYEFCYIGNYPSDLIYSNTRLLPPMSGQALAQELKQHHIYLTASEDESAGMHYIEAGNCGLPLLYIQSGGTPEYGQGFGVGFKKDQFFESLEEMREHYESLFEALEHYPFTSDATAQQYLELFQSLQNTLPTTPPLMHQLPAYRLKLKLQKHAQFLRLKADPLFASFAR